MRHALIAFFIFLNFVFPQSVSASDALGDFQGQFLELQKTVQNLTSTVTELKTVVADQNEVIREQAVRINVLESGKSMEKTGAKADAPMPLQGLTQGFNPDIGVVGTVQAHLTEDSADEEGKDTIALKELEVSFAQYVDPYSRLDAIIAFNDNLEDQNVDIEEAYYSHWGLPWGFRGQIGKFRTQIGKQNLLHLHQLDTVNYPLVIRDFFGEEGMASSGARLVHDIPNPWEVPVQVTGEVLRGNNGTSFSGISRRPIFNTHVKSFFELNDDLNLELGGTVMFGDENVTGDARGGDRFGVHVFGWDATLIWNLPQERQVKLQNEWYMQERSTDVFANHNPWGFYTLFDYRFARQWSAGIRFDYLEPLGVSGERMYSYEISPYLTFWQSEFANFRIQYTHSEPASFDAEKDDAIFLQANFLIGSHQHPVQ